jgi:hypothetical protein
MSSLKLKVEGNIFVLIDDFKYFGITVPKGYKFNGHSVPRLLMLFTGGRYEPYFINAAVVHDYMYETKKPRYEADKIYKSILKKEGNIKSWLVKSCYVAIRLFGRIRYR